MYCSECGKQNPDEAKFCMGCGSQMWMESGDVLKESGTFYYAGFWRRFAAFLIDFAIFSVLIFVIHTAITEGTASDSDSILHVISAIICWLYHALMESSSKQATIGKMALGIIVTDIKGNRISFWRATGRDLARYISSFILFIGYIMAGFTKKKQALHDIIAKTLVIKKQ